MLNTAQIERLLAPVVVQNRTETDRRIEVILSYLEKHKEALNQDLCKALNASDTLVNRLLRQLIDDGLVSTEIVKHQYKNSVGGKTTVTRRIIRLAK